MRRVVRKGSLDPLPVDVGSDAESVANVDPFDHQDAVLEFDLAGGVALESAFASRDVTRFQRASEGACQSAGGGGDDVVERRRTLRLASCRHTVVLGDGGVDAEDHRLILRGQVGAPQRPTYPLDSDSRDISDRSHPRTVAQLRMCLISRAMSDMEYLSALRGASSTALRRDRRAPSRVRAVFE